MEALSDFGLLLAFDTDEPEFARGFECGRIWERVKADMEPWDEMIHACNAEMVMRMCEAQEREFRAEDRDDDWMLVYVT